MSIKYKDILYKSKKKCTICKGDCYNDGIKIINMLICNKCIEEITLLRYDDVRYDYIKEAIGVNLINNFKAY